jgi:hypothetical protein
MPLLFLRMLFQYQNPKNQANEILHINHREGRRLRASAKFRGPEKHQRIVKRFMCQNANEHQLFCDTCR